MLPFCGKKLTGFVSGQYGKNFICFERALLTRENAYHAHLSNNDTVALIRFISRYAYVVVIKISTHSLVKLEIIIIQYNIISSSFNDSTHIHMNTQLEIHTFLR